MSIIDDVRGVLAGEQPATAETPATSDPNESLRIERLREELAGEIASVHARRGEIQEVLDGLAARRGELFIASRLHGADRSAQLAALDREEAGILERAATLDSDLGRLQSYREALLRAGWEAELVEIEAALVEHLPAGDGLAAEAVELLRGLLEAHARFHTWLRRTDDLLARRDNVSRALDLRLPGLPHAMGAVPLLSHLTREVLIGAARSPRSYSAALEVLERELARRTADPPTPRERTKPARTLTTSDLR